MIFKFNMFSLFVSYRRKYYRMEKFLKSLELTDEQRRQLELETRNQRDNPKWFEERRKRLTASNFGSICKMTSRASPQGVVERMINPKFHGNDDTNWGNEAKEVAFASFEKKTGLKVTKCGFIVHDKVPYLGASPNGLVGNDALIQVVCPSKCFDKIPEKGYELGEIKYLQQHDNELRLKENDNKYYQIQGQMYITKRKLCYFVTWTVPLDGIIIEEISFKQDFWENKMEQQLADFYRKHYLPRIVEVDSKIH